MTACIGRFLSTQGTWCLHRNCIVAYRYGKTWKKTVGMNRLRWKQLLSVCFKFPHIKFTKAMPFDYFMRQFSWYTYINTHICGCLLWECCLWFACFIFHGKCVVHCGTHTGLSVTQPWSLSDLVSSPQILGLVSVLIHPGLVYDLV